MEKRQALPDFAKGIAVLCMIQVHIIELLARPEIQTGLFGKISLFFGGPPAAPVFMAVMGFFALSSKKSIFLQILRGIKLLALGLALNIALNFNVLLHIFFFQTNANPFSYLFGVDILFLAGFSIIIIALIKPLFKKNAILYFLSALLISLLPVFTQGFSFTSNMAYVSGYLFSKATWSYFPLVPWLAYPLMGSGCYLLFQSQFLAKITPKIRLILLISLLVLLSATSIWAIPSITSLPLYYHHNILLFLWISGFLIAWFTLLEKIFTWSSRQSFTQYIIYIGKNVTAFYIIQWIIIGNTATVLFKSQSLLTVSIFMIGTLIITSLLVLSYNKYKQYRNKDVVL